VGVIGRHTKARGRVHMREVSRPCSRSACVCIACQRRQSRLSAWSRATRSSACCIVLGRDVGRGLRVLTPGRFWRGLRASMSVRPSVASVSCALPVSFRKRRSADTSGTRVSRWRTGGCVGSGRRPGSSDLCAPAGSEAQWTVLGGWVFVCGGDARVGRARGGRCRVVRVVWVLEGVARAFERSKKVYDSSNESRCTGTTQKLTTRRPLARLPAEPARTHDAYAHPPW